jgi:excisionase family DNA binding protein
MAGMGEHGEAWVSVAEAAQLLGKTTKTIQRMARRGELPYQEDGRRFLIDAAAIARLLPASPHLQAVATPDATVATPNATGEPAAIVLADVLPAGELAAMLQREHDRSVLLSHRVGALEEKLATVEVERDQLRARLQALEDSTATPVATVAIETRHDATPRRSPVWRLMRRLFGKV